MKFKGSIYCLNEGDLSDLLSSGGSRSEQKSGTFASSPLNTKPSIESATPTEQKRSLGPGQVRKILEEKLNKLSKQLEESDDEEEQTKLLELISKYLDTLNKL